MPDTKHTPRQQQIIDRLRIIDRPGVSRDLNCMETLRLRKEYDAIAKGGR